MTGHKVQTLLNVAHTAPSSLKPTFEHWRCRLARKKVRAGRGARQAKVLEQLDALERTVRIRRKYG